MSNIKPIYLIFLIIAILLVIYLKLSNPYREFSTSKYWENASVRSVSKIPQEALKPGNKNGPILMWAAIGANDPDILQALVSKGADINEADGFLKGTPLTGAAGYSKHPEIIDELIRLGADIHKTVHMDETALMIAAQYNHNPGITSALIKHGSKLEAKNKLGLTSLDYAKLKNNEIAIQELKNE